ncbi:MAG: nucleotidyltransferase domain-containing protein [Anaerolineae bacterium]
MTDQDTKPLPEKVTRQALVQAVIDAVESQPWSLAMWEAGAAALDRVDEWSDVDMMIVVGDTYADECLACVENALASLSPIALRYELPQPTWHGHAQVFYRLRDASEYLVLDLVVIERSSPADWFLERERHGRAVVYFDKAGLIGERHVSEDAWDDRLDRRLGTLRVTFPLFQSLTKKELRRGHDIEALSFYHGYTLRPLLELLRMIYVPHQHDFHTRYVHQDLPAEVEDRLVDLFFVVDAADIALKRDQAEEWFYEVLAALEDEPDA